MSPFLRGFRHLQDKDRAIRPLSPLLPKRRGFARVGKQLRKVYQEWRFAVDPDVTRFLECREQTVNVCQVILRTVLLFQLQVALTTTPNPCSVFIGPAKTNGKLGLLPVSGIVAGFLKSSCFAA
jgi:hypothetical protein